jgi:sugar lactone lactonase YvrE
VASGGRATTPPLPRRAAVVPHPNRAPHRTHLVLTHLTLALLTAAPACDAPGDSTSSGAGGTGTTLPAGGGGTGGTGGTTSTGGAGGTTSTSAGGAGGTTSTSAGGSSAGGNGGNGGAGGAPIDPNCAIPEGASALITEGIPAPGLACLRYPYPLSAPRDVVETADGQVFVTEFGAGRIVRLTGSGFVTVAEGLVAPIGLREENPQKLLVTEEGLHSLSRIDRATGAKNQIAAGMNQVTYLTRGPDGAAYVASFQEAADTQKGVVWRVDLTTGATLPFATGTNVTEGLFFDAQNRLHAADWLLPSAVYRFPAAGGPIANATQVASGFQNIYGIAADGAGGFYAADHAGKVVRVAPDGTKTDVVTSIGRPGGLWIAKNGDLLIAEFVDFGQTGYLLRITGL